MYPEYLLIPIDLPDKIQRITFSGRDQVEQEDVSSCGSVLIDPQNNTVRVAKAIGGVNWLLSDRTERHGPYLQNILLHSLHNPGQLGVVKMFVEHCKAAGITGKARQVLISDKEVIYILTIDHTGQYELFQLEDDTLFMHGAILTQQQIADQLNRENQGRLDRVGEAFDMFSAAGFTMPSLES